MRDVEIRSLCPLASILHHTLNQLERSGIDRLFVLDAGSQLTQAIRAAGQSLGLGRFEA